MKHKADWVALALVGRVGGKTLTRLLAHFGSLEAALSASQDELMRIPYLGRATATAITQIDRAQIEADCQRFTQSGVQIITWEDAELYPTNLLRCDDAPPVLFSRGQPHPDDSRAVAIVGTRTPRPESAALAHSLAAGLAAHGWTIVSGLALGIDAAAHEGALSAGGRTLAVLGSGVLRVYPPAHHSLTERIAQNGAVLSELHPDDKVSPQTLIARNRITSGLSRAVIVVQSGEDSGSMSTAHKARNQGRAVFAVIGGDSGCESLLADGAHPIHPNTLDYDALSHSLDLLSITQPPVENNENPQIRLL